MKRWIIRVVILSLLLAVTGQHATRVGADNSATVSVDGARRLQRIDGFGVNANSLPWDNGTLAPALGQLTDTLGASVWRVIVESVQGWQDTPDTGDPFTYDWSYYAQLYETPKFQALWGCLATCSRRMFRPSCLT